MKKLKKLGASLLALVMALAMVAPAMAAENPKDVTLDTKSNEHTFNVYQVFEAVPADGSSLKVDTIKWGKYVDSEKLIAALKTEYPDIFTEESYDAPALADVLRANFETPGSQYNNIDGNAKLAKVIAESGAFGRVVTMSSAEPQSVKTGYCVIVDTSNAGDSIYMLRTVTGNLTIIPKDSTSQVTKKVWDEETKAWTDGAIYKENENIQFQLKVTLPDDIRSGKWSNDPDKVGYDLVLHDKQDAGLTFNSDIVVKLDGTALAASNYTVVTEDLADDCTFEIRIDDAQELAGVDAGSVIEVTYTAKLNENAVTGVAGNKNNVRMTVNNTEVPGEEVKVFELELDVDKTDGDGNPLAGAQFALYNEADVTDGVVSPNTEPAYTLVASTEDIEVDGVTWPAGSKFSVKGLKAGTYYLVETEAPAGYEGKEITPIKVKVEASTEATPSGAEGGKLIVAVKNESGFTVADNGVIGGTVVNRLGVTLPETGGIGTTIFYIAGGALAIGAVVLLITKRRVGSADDE